MKDVDDLIARNSTLLEENTYLRRQWEELTPGGSEFHDNPRRCQEWIKDRLSTIIAICKERNSVRDENTRLRAQLERAKKALELIKMHANPDMDNHVQYYDIACRALKELGGDE